MQPDSCSKLPFHDNLTINESKSGVLNRDTGAVSAHITRTLDRVARGQQYSPELCQLAGKMTAGIFLSRCVYWYRTVKGPFHKANQGDETSWKEQDGFQTRYELSAARRVVATKVKKSQVKDYLKITPDMLNWDADAAEWAGLDHCVLYWRNPSNKMWYRVNEALIEALLIKQATPERDNTEILWAVKALYPDADIVLPDLPLKAPDRKPEKLIPFKDATPEKEPTYAYLEPIGPEPSPQPQAEKPKPDRFKTAIAVGHGWRKNDGTPNTAAPALGRYITFYLGTAKKGDWKEYGLTDTPMGADEIAGFWLWYQWTIKKEAGKYPDKLPMRVQTLNRRALEFLSIEQSTRQQWIDKGRDALDKKIGHRTDDKTGEKAITRVEPGWEKRVQRWREEKRRKEAERAALEDS